MGNEHDHNYTTIEEYLKAIIYNGHEQHISGRISTYQSSVGLPVLSRFDEF